LKTEDAPRFTQSGAEAKRRAKDERHAQSVNERERGYPLPFIKVVRFAAASFPRWVSFFDESKRFRMRHYELT